MRLGDWLAKQEPGWLWDSRLENLVRGQLDADLEIEHIVADPFQQREVAFSADYYFLTPKSIIRVFSRIEKVLPPQASGGVSRFPLRYIAAVHATVDGCRIVFTKESGLGEWHLPPQYRPDHLAGAYLAFGAAVASRVG